MNIQELRGGQWGWGCPLVFHDFGSITGTGSRGTGAIWCLERLQMALIRTYKICLPHSLRRHSEGSGREGNWWEKGKKKKKKNTKTDTTDTESHFSEGSSNQIFIKLRFPSLAPFVPWCRRLCLGSTVIPLFVWLLCYLYLPSPSLPPNPPKLNLTTTKSLWTCHLKARHNDQEKFQSVWSTASCLIFFSSSSSCPPAGLVNPA